MKCLALALLPGALLMSTAPALASDATLSDATPRVLFSASEGSGRVAVDSSSFHNDGALRGGVSRIEGTYRFHPGVPHDRIRVDHDPSLNPGSQPFAFGATIRVSPNAIWQNNEMAVIRHGDSDTPGGDYKIELKQTIRGTVTAFCVMHDGNGGSGYVRGDGQLTTIDDGQWHTITCSREPSAETVSLTIDGFTKASPDDGLGSIVGFDPLLVGVQPTKDGTGLREQFAGRMDDIRIAVVS